MSDPIVTDQAKLLEIFEATYTKIIESGSKHAVDNANAGAKRISSVAAISTTKDTRELGVIDHCGIVRSFAKVNGKGYVETVNDVNQADMESMLKKAGHRVANTVPCQPDAGMYHYSSKGPAKVF